MSKDYYVAAFRSCVRGGQASRRRRRPSMNAWIERVLDVEDMRRRCAAHGKWMSGHPEAVSISEAWADRNLDELARR